MHLSNGGYKGDGNNLLGSFWAKKKYLLVLGTIFVSGTGWAINSSECMLVSSYLSIWQCVLLCELYQCVDSIQGPFRLILMPKRRQYLQLYAI